MTVTINRPERRNAANEEVWRGLESAVVAAETDASVRVLVLTGAGGAFCSGQDLAALSDGPASSHLESMRRLGRLVLRLQQLPKPTIAKVGGVAAGAGVSLALCCDLVVASRDARFIQVFVARGLSPDLGCTWLLPRLVGMAKAKELAMIGDPLPAEEAAALGLISKVVDPDQLDRSVEDWARRLADGPGQALSLTKALLNESFESSLERALEAEARAQAVNFAGPESKEALAAFLEKRPARFRRA